MENRKMQQRPEPKITIGIKDMDEQHKNFFQIVERLHKLTEDEYDPKTTRKLAPQILEIIQDLSDFSLKHFHTEEQLFDATDYPDAEEHKRDHNRFMTDILYMEADIENGQPVPLAQLRHYINDWVRTHIPHMDKGFVAYLEKP